MKKILYTTLFSLLALSMGSCVNEVEEVFETPASDRLEQAMLECKQLLSTPEYGWLIEYYPDENQSFGGFAYAAKFEPNGNVAVTSELAGDPSQVVTSHYSINASTSTVLTFDTYNDYIHFFSDPDDHAGNYYGGDFDWAYVKGDANRMEFRGVKTGNAIVFTALQQDIVSSIQAVITVKNEVADKLYTGFEWEVNGQVVKLYAGDTGSSLTYYPDGNTEGAYEEYPYGYTNEGISLIKPLTANGVTVQRFAWDSATETFTATDAVSETGAPVSVTMKGWYREGFIHYDDLLGDYTLRYISSVSGTAYTTKTVKLVENVKNESYYIQGLHNSFPNNIRVTYSKSTSGLAIDYQSIGRYNNNPAFVVCGSGHSFFTAAGTGFDLENISEEEGKIVFKFYPMGSATDIYLVYNSGGYGLIAGFYKLDTMTKK